MIKACLRRVHSPDVPDLNAYVPHDQDRFGILVQAMIGPEDGEGEESFDFLVCTPAWLADRIAMSGPVFGRHHLFLSHYHSDLLHELLRGLCERASGPDWESVAAFLGRYGKWEFEDYREADG